MLPSYKPPAKCTGEEFGVAYLYQQSGRNLVCKDQDLDNLIDEGFEDFTEDESATGTSVSSAPDSSDPTVVAPSEEDNSDAEEVRAHYSLRTIIDSVCHLNMHACNSWKTMLKKTRLSTPKVSLVGIRSIVSLGHF